MPSALITRRTMLASGSASLAAASLPLAPAFAQGLQPTPSMRGGSNNYLPGAPVVERIGAPPGP